MGKLRQMVSVTEERGGLNLVEGQDTTGAERPSSVQRQSSDLNLGLGGALRTLGAATGSCSLWHLSQQDNIQASHSLLQGAATTFPQTNEPGQAELRVTEIQAQASENRPNIDIQSSCLPRSQATLCLSCPREASPQPCKP